MTSTSLIVVQARASVAGLPEQATADVGGRPLLALLLERLRPVTAQIPSTVIVATSDRPADDPVEAIATGLGFGVVRGAQSDPLGQFAIASVRHPADAIVRIDGSCPMVDPFVIAAAVGLHERSEADFTTNLLPRTYPRGLDVEVLSARTLRMAELEADPGAERDGITTFVVRRPERFRLANLTSGHSLGQEQWAVDTPEGLDRMREIVRLLPDPTTASWNRILAVVGRTTKPRPGQIVLRPIDNAEPGSSPWVRTWAVDVDGRTVGTTSVSAGSGRSERHVGVTGEWVEPTRDALYRLLLDDPQIAP